MALGPHAAFSVGPSALVIVSLRLPSPLGWAGMELDLWPSRAPSHFPTHLLNSNNLALPDQDF
jgi:hypothetical protein